MIHGARAGSEEKGILTSGLEVPYRAEDDPLVEGTARRVGILLAMVGVALMVLSAVLGDGPF
jgi:hypothetical protein